MLHFRLQIWPTFNTDSCENRWNVPLREKQELLSTDTNWGKDRTQYTSVGRHLPWRDVSYHLANTKPSCVVYIVSSGAVYQLFGMFILIDANFTSSRLEKNLGCGIYLHAFRPLNMRVRVHHHWSLATDPSIGWWVSTTAEAHWYLDSPD